MTIENPPSRYGFYYFPDTVHYRENDIHTWIPELRALGASWLTLLAPADRAIPEMFIKQMIQAGIQPIIHLPFPTIAAGKSDEIAIFFEAYSHWGVRYITLFDRPNVMKNWSASDWAQSNLVERFLDIFIPKAEMALQAGLIPVFPPLEPGGDYWDTAFLLSALQGLLRRGEKDLLTQLALSAYAWSGNRSPNWGAGGPERWPNTRPYTTPAGSEDQLGFRIFDWYLAITKAILGKALPIILLGAGSMIGDQQDRRSPAVDIQAHTWQNITLARLISGQSAEYDTVPIEVISCNFWLLSAAENDREVENAWYKPNREQMPIVTVMKEWIASGDAQPSSAAKTIPTPYTSHVDSRPIAHYLLLPNFEWGMTEWHMEAIRPFVNKYQPTIGFSPVEASHAKKVTVVAGATKIPESIIDGLLAAGCVVEQISADGMNIATSAAHVY